MKTYIFKDDGLRFDTKYLQEMRLAILQLQTDEQSEFVDAITYDHCKRGIPIISADKLNADVFININATAIGNLAFIALNHPMHEQQVYARVILDKIKKGGHLMHGIFQNIAAAVYCVEIPDSIPKLTQTRK